MNSTTLYKRNAQGKPIFWSIEDTDVERKLKLNYGLVGRIGTTSIVMDTTAKGKLYDSMVTAKRKEGYLGFRELYDDAPDPDTVDDIKKYLDTYLPKFNQTTSGKNFCMLAKTLEDAKAFKNGYLVGQYKINGLRCNIYCERVVGDMFRKYKYRYFSREGTEWDLSFLDGVLTLSLTDSFIDRMIEEGVALDGEIYLPGYTVNEINSFAKNSKIPQHYQLQYWCYDICMEAAPYKTRGMILNEAIRNEPNRPTMWADRLKHFNNTLQFVAIPSCLVASFNDAVYYRDKFINLGFEGLILRDPNAEYQFGKRNSAMYKYKKIHDGFFTVVDVVPEGAKRSNLAKFVLRNDINAECFECTCNYSQATQAYILQHKHDYIDNHVKVEYRERSGVKQVPFHAKVVDINIK